MIDQHIHLSFELCQDARKPADRRAGAGHVTHSEGFLRPLCLVNQHLRVGDQVVQSIYLVGHGVSLLAPFTVTSRRTRRGRAGGAVRAALGRPRRSEVECHE